MASTSALMLTPSSASTSAVPVLEDCARLPCLATGTPRLAVTMAAAVEMLSVPLPSPPVPTMSMAPAGARTFLHFARMIVAAPVISSIDSPRSRRIIRKPPICAAVAWPDMMTSKASSASACVSAESSARVMKGLSALPGLVAGSDDDMHFSSRETWMAETGGLARLEPSIASLTLANEPGSIRTRWRTKLGRCRLTRLIDTRDAMPARERTITYAVRTPSPRRPRPSTSCALATTARGRRGEGGGEGQQSALSPARGLIEDAGRVCM